MLITRRSRLSGRIKTLDIPVTIEQLYAWDKGGMIQDVMPNLTPAQREFILSGVTEEEWDSLRVESENY